MSSRNKRLNSKASNLNNNNTKEKRNWDSVISISALILSFVSVGFSIWYNSNSYQALILSQEPYIAVDNFIPIIDKNNNLQRYELFIKNLGARPAKNISFFSIFYNTSFKYKDDNNNQLNVGTAIEPYYQKITNEIPKDVQTTLVLSPSSPIQINEKRPSKSCTIVKA